VTASLGHERAVWALLDLGSPETTIKNRRGLTALVSGYLFLWTRPPEAKVRAISKLAQFCGPKQIAEARAIIDAILPGLLKNSRQLVDHAADGDALAMRRLLKDFADPESASADGTSALSAAAYCADLPDAALLVDFKAHVDFADSDGMTALSWVLKRALGSDAAPKGGRGEGGRAREEERV